MRKIISIILCLLMILTVIGGCSSAPEESTPSAESSKEAVSEESEEPTKQGTPVGNGSLTLNDDPVELEMWIEVTDVDDTVEMEDEVWDELVTEFQKLYPNVSIKLVGVGADSTEAFAVYQAAATANNLPELFVYTNDQLLNWYNSGVIYDYADYLSDDYFNAYSGTAIENCNTLLAGTDAICGSPITLEVEGWLLNSELFAANDLDIPYTHSDLLDCIEVFKANGIAAIGQSIADNWAIWGYKNMLNQYGSQHQHEALQSGELAVEDSAFALTFDKIYQLYEAGAFSEDCTTSTYDQVCAEFCVGKYPIMQCPYSFKDGYMKQYLDDPEAYADYLPMLNNTEFIYGFDYEDDLYDENEIVGTKVCNWCIQMGSVVAEDDQKLAAAVAFIEYCVSEDAYDYWAIQSSTIPLVWESDASGYDFSQFAIERSYREAIAMEGDFYCEGHIGYDNAIVAEYKVWCCGLIVGELTPDECNVQLQALIDNIGA